MATQVSQFSLVFNVDGSWESDLSNLPKLFNNASSAADEFALRTTDASQKAATAMQALDKIRAAGDRLLDVGKRYFGGMKGFITEGMLSLVPMETAMQRIKGLTGASQEATAGIVEEALTLAERTPFESQDVIDITAALAMAKVNLGAFRDEVTGMEATLASMNKRGFAKVGQDILDFAGDMKVTSASIIGDLAAMTGKSGAQMQFFVRSMSRALSSGNLGMMRDDLPDAIRQAIFETSGNKSKVTAQKAMDNLFKFLREKGQIGAAAAASGTLEAYITGFKELKTILFRKIFGLPGDPKGFYEQFKGILAGIYNDIQKAFVDPKLLASVRGFFEPVLGLATKLGDAIKRTAVTLLDFVKNHPKLMKFLGTFSMIAAGALVVAGAILSLIAGLAGLVLAFKAAVAGVVLIKGALLAVGLIAIKVIAVIGLIAAAGYALYKAYETNWGGLRDIIDGVRLVVVGLYEGITNMTDRTTYLSEETAKGLAKLGLLEFVLDLLMVASNIFTFFRSVKEGFLIAFESWAPTLEDVNTTFGVLWESIKGLFIAVGKLLGVNFELNTSWTSSSNIGGFLGVVLGEMVGIALRLVQAFVLLVSGIISFVSGVVTALRVVNAFFNPLSMLISMFKSLWTAFGLLVSGDILGAFKELGLGIMSFMLTPIQLLIRGIVTVMELLGKKVPNAMKGIAEGGFRTLLEPTKDWTLPGELQAGFVDPYAGLPEDVKAKLIARAKFGEEHPESKLMSYPAEAMAEQPSNVFPFPFAAAMGHKLQSLPPATPETPLMSMPEAAVPEARSNVIQMVPRTDLQQRTMASDQVAAIQEAGYGQSRMESAPVNVSVQPQISIYNSADADGLSSWLSMNGQRQEARVVGR